MAIYMSVGLLAMVMATSSGSGDLRAMRVQLGGPPRSIVANAMVGAVDRLETPACRRLLTDFTDQSGRPLWETLAATGLTLPAYVSRLFAVEGEGQRGCTNPRIRAFTAPGSHVIFVCSTHFGAVSEMVSAQLTFIHEILHTLGLGENPPSSALISRMVAVRCRAYS